MPKSSPKPVSRCEWPKSELDILYHDTEWGVPVHDDTRLFEAFTLGGAQAGLSWSTILKRREGYREAFHRFDIAKVARMGPKDVERLMLDTRIIRNRLKIESTLTNARAAIKVIESHGSLDQYLWSFVEGRPIVNQWKSLSELPPTSPASDAMSKDMKAKGFRFVGSTICYATMQGIGMINDHVTSCFRYKELR
ncbi:MAG: DNA-3-methyladenine glycosylase I [Candidatus Hydrogenedentota bacterium]